MHIKTNKEKTITKEYFEKIQKNIRKRQDILQR